MKYSRLGKNVARLENISNLSALPKRTSVLTLPGPDALCVRTMIETNILTANCRQNWIENNFATFNKLRRIAQTLPIPSPVINHVNLFEYYPKMDIDFANIDTEGGFNPELGLWITDKLSPALADGAVVSLTITKNCRNNLFPNWFLELSKTNRFIHELIQISFDVIYPYGDLDCAITNTLLRCALGDFHIEQMPFSKPYKDGRRFIMLVDQLLLTQRRSKRIYPPIQDLLKRYIRDAKSIAHSPYEIGLLCELRSAASLHNLVIELDADKRWAVKSQYGHPFGLMPSQSLDKLADQMRHYGFL